MFFVSKRSFFLHFCINLGWMHKLINWFENYVLMFLTVFLGTIVINSCFMNWRNDYKCMQKSSDLFLCFCVDCFIYLHGYTLQLYKPKTGVKMYVCIPTYIFLFFGIIFGRYPGCINCITSIKTHTHVYIWSNFFRHSCVLSLCFWAIYWV